MSFISRLLITSRGLTCLSWRAGLSLVGVIGAVKLDRPQVEHHRLLDVVHHRQTITVAKHHTGGGGWYRRMAESRRKGGKQSRKTERMSKFFLALIN